MFKGISDLASSSKTIACIKLDKNVNFEEFKQLLTSDYQAAIDKIKVEINDKDLVDSLVNSFLTKKEPAQAASATPAVAKSESEVKQAIANVDAVEKILREVTSAMTTIQTKLTGIDNETKTKEEGFNSLKTKTKVIESFKTIDKINNFAVKAIKKITDAANEDKKTLEEYKKEIKTNITNYLNDNPILAVESQPDLTTAIQNLQTKITELNEAVQKLTSYRKPRINTKKKTFGGTRRHRKPTKNQKNQKKMTRKYTKE